MAVVEKSGNGNEGRVAAAHTADLKAEARGSGAESRLSKRAEQEALLSRLNEFYTKLHTPYVNIEEEAKAIVLAIITKENVLFVSEPGTAKSSLAERAAALLDGKVFKKQLNRYTTPEEIFGHQNIKKLMEEGKFEHVTDGMLPEANIAFIDEIFRGSTAIRDTLLEIMVDKKMSQGNTTRYVPLKTVISASNFVSNDEEDHALYDRFLFRYFITPLEKQYWPALIDASFNAEFKGSTKVDKTVLTMEDIDSIYAKIAEVDTSKIKSALYETLSILEERFGIHTTNRRKGKTLKVIAAHALFNGRMVASVEDLIALKYLIPTDEDDAKRVTSQLESIISPKNHINQLSEQIKSFTLALQSLEKDPKAGLKDRNDSLMTAEKTKAHARMVLKLYSDKELRAAARKTVRHANMLISRINQISEEEAAEESRKAGLAETVRTDEVS